MNTQLCCERYSVSLNRFATLTESWLGIVSSAIYAIQSNAGIIYELLLAKSGFGVISSLFFVDMDFIIHYLCVL